jgi:hypothetical protein
VPLASIRWSHSGLNKGSAVGGQRSVVSFAGSDVRPSFCVLQSLTDRLGIDTLLVPFQEEFCADDTIGFDDKRAGVGNALSATLCFAVKNPVRLNGLAAGIGKQRVGDRMFRGEPVENGRGIVANGHDLTAGRFQFFQAGLQLDQLLLAEGSPICRTEKDQRHRTFLEKRFERDVVVRLIFKSEQWRLFSNGQSGMFWRGGLRRIRRQCQENPGNGESRGESDQFHVGKG